MPWVGPVRRVEEGKRQANQEKGNICRKVEERQEKAAEKTQRFVNITRLTLVPLPLPIQPISSAPTRGTRVVSGKKTC